MEAEAEGEAKADGELEAYAEAEDAAKLNVLSLKSKLRYV